MEHLALFVAVLTQQNSIRRLAISEVLGKDQQSVDLRQGTQSDGNMMEKFFRRVSCVPFGDVRRDRDRRSAQLAC